MKKYTEEELKIIIKNHQHFLDQDCEGWQNMKADLTGANLRGANLQGANFQGTIYEKSIFVGEIEPGISRKEEKMMKKYELTAESIVIDGKTLFRIKALADFGDVKKGELGGYVEREENLENDIKKGNAWVYDEAKVYGDARVFDDARVFGKAQVYGDARVFDNAKVYRGALIYGEAEVYNHAEVCGDTQVYDSARVCGDSVLCWDTEDEIELQI